MNGRNRSYVHAVPAQPGFNVLEVIHGQDASPAAVRRLPVLAWALEECPHVPYLPYPITLEGVKDDGAIELPDGRVETPAAVWDSAGQWLEDQLEQAAVAHPVEAAKMLANSDDIRSRRLASKAEVCR